MSGFLSRLAGALIVPPGSLFIAGALGALIARKRKRLGHSICAGAALLLFVLCLPWVAGMLLCSLQTSPALPPEGSGQALPEGAGAVVVLAAGWNPAGPEYGAETVDALTLERLRYAAVLARRADLPVLTSGGAPERARPALAELMRTVLERDFRVEVRWIEPDSANTRQNARSSAAILFGAGVERVFLVTHAWHMPRALAAFRDAGLDPIPAPTAFRVWPRLEWSSFWPSARAMRETTWALHEWIGRAWYAASG